MKQLLKYLNSSDLPAVILNNAFDGIICYLPILSPSEEIIDFELIYMNNAALNILPGKKEEYIGKRFLSLFPYSIKNGLFEEMKVAFRSGERSEHVYYFETSTKKWWSQNSIVKYDGGLVVYSRDVTEKKKLELVVERRNSELQTLMQEIHHRVKNNLQIITSMLNLQKDAMRDEKYVEAIEVCSQRIRTMAIIHQKLYETKSYSVVNIQSFIMEIIGSLLKLYSDIKFIDIKYEMDEIELDVDNVIKIGIILNELLTNSLKYAFPKNKPGEIFIGVKKQETSLNLKISDNGEGLPSNFNIDKTPTVGMVIVKAFTEQMGGDIKIISPPGTTFIITLPINNHDKKS